MSYKALAVQQEVDWLAYKNFSNSCHKERVSNGTRRERAESKERESREREREGGREGGREGERESFSKKLRVSLPESFSMNLRVSLPVEYHSLIDVRSSKVQDHFNFI